MSAKKLIFFEKISSDFGFSKRQSIETAETLVEIIKSSLIHGEDAMVSGFGKCCLKKSSEERAQSGHRESDIIEGP